MNKLNKLIITNTKINETMFTKSFLNIILNIITNMYRNLPQFLIIVNIFKKLYVKIQTQTK